MLCWPHTENLWDKHPWREVKVLVAQLCLTLWAHDLWPTRLFCPWNSPGKSAGVGSHSLLQGIFLTQGSNPGLSHCRQILYHLSHHAHLKINPARPLGGQWDRLPMTSVNHTGLSDFCSHYFCNLPAALLQQEGKWGSDGACKPIRQDLGAPPECPVSPGETGWLESRPATWQSFICPHALAFQVSTEMLQFIPPSL